MFVKPGFIPQTHSIKFSGLVIVHKSARHYNCSVFGEHDSFHRIIVIFINNLHDDPELKILFEKYWRKQWYFDIYNNCSDLQWEKIVLVIEKKLLKFKAEGREFAKCLRSLEQFIQTVKGQNNFW